MDTSPPSGHNPKGIAMDVFLFRSNNEQVEVRASTAANIHRLYHRFTARVGSEEKAMAYCDYSTTIPGVLEIVRPSSDGLQQVGDFNSKDFHGNPPVFYETAAYNFNIRFKDVEGAPVIIHRLKEIPELFTPLHIQGNEWLLSGQLDFLNEPGIFDLTFRYRPIGGQERTDTVQFRVVSPKLDTKEDYNYILADISREYNEIVFQYLTKTFQNLNTGGKSDNDVVWLSIFRQVVEQYIKAVSYIVNRPHLRERKDVQFSRADRIKRWTPEMAQRFAEHEQQKTLDRAHFRHEITENTGNTRENRFVKFTLDRICRRLDAIFTRIRAKAANPKSEIDPSELQELNGYQSRLRKLANSSLLRSLKGEPLRNESIVLQKKTGYAQIYRYWLMLQKGIELFEGSNYIGVRPIWELYELWCFLKMRSMVAEILELHFENPEEIIETPIVMIEPFSDSKAEHTITYFYGSDVVKLHYQHTYNRRSGEIHTATTDNRPDIVLAIMKPDKMELTYLYDAKYRVTDDDRLSREDAEEIQHLKLKGADYPPSDAINQMHRYRDAIYYGEDRLTRAGFAAKEIIGGYILFPGRGDDESIKERYYYKSIETVNIGAFPLLPNHTDHEEEGNLLRQHLTRILTEQNAYEQIKDSIPQRGLLYTQSLVNSNDLVLVGYYKTDQLNPILDNKLYYVPAALGKGSINLVSGFESTRYLLLHHDKTRMMLELTGEGPRFYPATELEKMGFAPTDKYYLGFEIKSRKPLEIKDLDLEKLNLRTRGQQSTRPYFTTFAKLKETSF